MRHFMKIESRYDNETQKSIKDIRDKIYKREQMYFELAASTRNDKNKKSYVRRFHVKNVI